MTVRGIRASVTVGSCAIAAFVVASAGGLTGADIISTVGGNGTPGFSGDGGTALAAQLKSPQGVAVDAAGNLYVADMDNNRVRRITPAGTIATFAGTGVAGSAGDGGPAVAAQLNQPFDVAVDGNGNVFVSELGGNRVRKVSPGGVITTVAGIGTAGFSGDGGPATGAQFNGILGIDVDAAGNLYLADDGNSRIRKVSAAGIVTTIAGTGTGGFSGDGGQATSAQLARPGGLAVDASGNVYVGDRSNKRLRRITPAGVITTIAGTGVEGFTGDGGQATSAQLSGLAQIAVGPDGTVYVASGLRVRAVSPGGTITTVAGTGTAGFSGDGGPAVAAQFNQVTGVGLDLSGNLYITDSQRHIVRKVTASASGLDAAVAADVLGARAARKANGKRVVRLELDLEEPLAASLTLLRGATVLSSKQFTSVPSGRQLLALGVPKRVARGTATLSYELRDLAGNTVRGQLAVRIGKR